MTNSEIFTAFESIIGDSLDRTLEVQLANMAKNKLETTLQLEITKKLDTSQTSTVGGTYLTQYSLASDILVPLGRIYVGTNPRLLIPLERRIEYKDAAGFFYIDLRQSKFCLTGTVATAEAITFPYIYKTASIADDTNTVVVWPSDFHLLIPIEMAKIWPSIDQAGKEWDYTDRWQALYTELKNSLIDWDHSYKALATDGMSPYPEQLSPSENRINF